MKKIFLFCFLLLAITVFSFTTASAATPALSGITVSPNPIKGGATITITPSGQGDDDASVLQFFCNETGSATLADTNCSEKDTSYATPYYSSIACTFIVAIDDANHNVSCRLFDGNEYSADQNASFTTDSTLPTTIFSGCNNQWNTTDQTIAFSCASGETCTTQFKIDNGSITSTTLATDGNHKIEYFSTDSVGNADGNIEVPRIDYCAIDKPPVTTSDVNNNAWQNFDANVHLFCNDGGLSPCSITRYKINGGDWQTFDSSILISAEGTHTLDFNSTDVNAKAETTKTVTVKIDKTKPSTTYSGCNSGWNTSNQISFTCSDNSGGSDCSATQFRIDTGSWQNGTNTTLSDGSHTIEYYSTDAAQNPEAIKTINCAIDTTAPSVTINNSPSTSGRNVTISWSATDSGSGVQLYYLYRNSSTDSNYIYSGPLTSFTDTALPDGTYYYKIKAIDNIGNKSGFSSEVSATISSTSVPTTSTVSSGPASIWIKLSISSADFAKAGKFPITITGDEPFEGGYQIKIKLPNSNTFKDIASAASYSGKSVSVEYEFKNGEDGNASIVAVAWSSSGSRAEKEKTITIDTKIPSIELLAPKANAMISGIVELKANATDANSIAKEVSFYYRKGSSGEWQPIPAAATRNGNAWSGKWNTAGLSDAKYEFKAVASDAAGNKAEKIIELKISNIAVLGITGNAEVQSEALFSFKESDLNAMFASVLANNSLAEEAKKMATDCNVSRALKIIKISDGNKQSYKASVFLGFRNNSRQNLSVRLVEVIPKEFAENAGAIESTEPFSIIESDPIVAWDLNSIPAGKAVEIVYSLKNSLTEELATKLAESRIMQKFAAPPIVVSSTSQLGKNDFNSALTSATTTGFFGIASGNLLAIIAGLIVAAIIVSALFFARSGFSFGSKSSYASTKPLDLAYKEAMHKKIIDKISAGLNEFIGYKQQSGHKWVFKKEEPATGLKTKKEGGLKQLFGNLEFTIAKKTEKQKLEGKSKWAFKEQNMDI